MQNQTKSTRSNKLRFTGNVSQVKPLQNGGAAISLAYNEGKMVNDKWETSDTLFMQCIVPAKFNLIPNIGDRMTIEGFLASDNFQPEGGKKRYGVKIIINLILEHKIKQQQQQAPQHNGYQNQPAPQQGGYQNQPAPQQGGYQKQGFQDFDH